MISLTGGSLPRFSQSAPDAAVRHTSQYSASPSIVKTPKVSAGGDY